MKHYARLNHLFIILGVHESSVYISGFNLGYQWTTEALKNEFLEQLVTTQTGQAGSWKGTEQIYIYTYNRPVEGAVLIAGAILPVTSKNVVESIVLR